MILMFFVNCSLFVDLGILWNLAAMASQPAAAAWLYHRRGGGGARNRVADETPLFEGSVPEIVVMDRAYLHHTCMHCVTSRRTFQAAHHRMAHTKEMFF